MPTCEINIFIFNEEIWTYKGYIIYPEWHIIFLDFCCDKTSLSKAAWRGKGLFHFHIQSIIKGSQQELNTGTDAEAVEECCLLAWPMTCSASFLIVPGTANPKVPLLIADSHVSQSCPEANLVEHFLEWSFLFPNDWFMSSWCKISQHSCLKSLYWI